MNKLTNNDRELLKSKSAYILPNNPSDKGLSADQIKKRLYEGLMLLFEWLKRAIEDTDNIDKKYEEELKNYVKNVDGIATNLKLQGTITADSQAVINLSNVIKVLIPQPTENNSAIRKLDLDNVNNNLDAKKVNKTNDTLYNPTVSGTLKGDFLLGTQGTADMSPTTKKYTDDKLNDLKSATSSDLLATKNELQTNINQARQYAEQLINNLINGAPSAFDTLKEIADYISSDQSATSAMLASIQKNAQDILLKANSNDVYTKEEVDNKLDYKANSTDVYKKSEVDNLLNKKQDTLKSGENIKTIGGLSILGAGNIPTPESNTTIQVIGNPEGAGTEVLNTLLIGEKIYKIKEGYVNLDVECDHEYEITGKTGHEYGVAIEDSQMLLKKIQGQTRRYSLNLFNPTTIDITGDKGISATTEDNILVLNGTASDNVYINCPVNIPAGTYSFGFTSNSPVDIYVQYDGSDYTDSHRIYKDNPTLCQRLGIVFDKPITNILVTAGTGDSFSNKKIYFQLNEGSTLEPFQPYDDTLVNSKANLISTGRNLFNPEGVNLDEHTTRSNDVFNISYSNAYQISIEFKKPFHLIKGVQYYISRNILSGSFPYGRIQLAKPLIGQQLGDRNDNIYFDSDTSFTLNEDNSIVAIFISSGSATVQTCSFTLQINTVKKYDYEPYIEDSYPIDIELGAYDHIDNVSHLLVKQTSNVITYDGSSSPNFTVTQHDETNYAYAQLVNSYTTDKVYNVYEMISVYPYKLAINGWTQSGNEYTYMYLGDGIYRILFPYGTTLEQAQDWFTKHPFQVVFKLNAQTTEQLLLPAGYAVYTGGLQQQVIAEGKYLPYVLSKEYAVSMAAQIKTNIEIDRVQQEQINEYKSKLSSLEQRLAALEELNTNKIIL